MKKLIGKIIYSTILFPFLIMVFANSGPVFWQGYPSSNIMSIDGNSPIAVKSENLVFDFSDYEGDKFTISGNITADYEMENPANETQVVHMAFPVVEALIGLSTENIVITADGNVLPYEIYAGDAVDGRGNPGEEGNKVSFDFASIVGTITNEPYKSENFAENEKGKLYIIEVNPSSDERINFAVDFYFDHKKTKVLVNGFNRYERSGEKTRIASWCNKSDVLEIFVLGEDTKLNINAYTDGELSKKTDLVTYSVSAQEANLRSYLMEYVKKNTNAKNIGAISENQLYNIYAKTLDRSLTRNMGFSSQDDILEQEHINRILTLVYTVEFPPQSEKKVSVRYKTTGTMDRRETAKPLYSFDYILNPAENWSGFKNLNIEIIPPKEVPYIVKSSVELTKGENNIYTAVLEELPENDLSFTLYENEKITLLDKTAGNLNNIFGYMYPIVIAGIVLVIGAVILVITLKGVRK